VAVTDRLSSNDPNLQNIPVDCSKADACQSLGACLLGSQIASADYSQIELRISGAWDEVFAVRLHRRDGRAARRLPR
jgi:DNA polymerase-1